MPLLYKSLPTPITVKVARILGGQTFIGYARDEETADVLLSSPRELVAIPNSDGTTQITFLPVNNLGPIEYAKCEALLLKEAQLYSVVVPVNAPDLIEEYQKAIFPDQPEARLEILLPKQS